MSTKKTVHQILLIHSLSPHFVQQKHCRVVNSPTDVISSLSFVNFPTFKNVDGISNPVGVDSIKLASL